MGHVHALQARYPPLPQQRLQRAVWRGSNTDSRFGLMDEKNALSIMRTRLHMFGLWYPDIIDAHYTAFAQQAFQTNCVEELLSPGGHCSQHWCGISVVLHSTKHMHKTPSAYVTAGSSSRSNACLWTTLKHAPVLLLLLRLLQGSTAQKLRLLMTCNDKR
jgi:hypothetical protein